MWPYIYKDFGISDGASKNALALITTFFLVAYALGHTFAGKLMDKIGTRFGMTFAIVGWSVSISLHSLARALFSFNIFRFFLGFFEAGNWPGATKNNAEWFPPQERAIAQGIFGASTAIGSVIAGPVIALLFLAYGWESTFFSIGGLGLLWTIPWLIINKASPEKHPWLTEVEQEHILSNSTRDSIASPQAGLTYTWRQLLRFKNTWGILLGRFFLDPVWWLFITWLPTFLKEQFLFDIKQIAAFSWFPYLLAALGGIAGGYFSFKFIHKGIKAAIVRNRAITIGCIIMFLSLALLGIFVETLKSHPYLLMFIIGLALFGFQFLISNLQTLPSDFYKGSNVGTVAGMGGTAAVLGTLATTWLVPLITQVSYSSFFFLGCILVPLGWMSVIFIPVPCDKSK